MYTVYSFDYSGEGVGKSAAFFKTKKEAEYAQKTILENAKQNGREIKICVDETNELSNKIRHMPPTAAIYYFEDLIFEIDKLQNQVNELTNQLRKFTEDQ